MLLPNQWSCLLLYPISRMPWFFEPAGDTVLTRNCRSWTANRLRFLARTVAAVAVIISAATLVPRQVVAWSTMVRLNLMPGVSVCTISLEPRRLDSTCNAPSVLVASTIRTLANVLALKLILRTIPWPVLVQREVYSAPIVVIPTLKNCQLNRLRVFGTGGDNLDVCH